MVPKLTLPSLWGVAPKNETATRVYRVYYHPCLPLDRVLEQIVVPKGRDPIWTSWRATPWKNWDSPRTADFFRAMLKDIDKHGVRKPVLLWDYAVVTGGTRLMCAKALGKLNIPAILSLRDDLGEPPDGAKRLYHIGHPEILGHNPNVIVWKKDQPLYLGYPKWDAKNPHLDYQKPTDSESSSGVVSFPGKLPSLLKQSD